MSFSCANADLSDGCGKKKSLKCTVRHFDSEDSVASSRRESVGIDQGQRGCRSGVVSQGVLPKARIPPRRAPGRSQSVAELGSEAEQSRHAHDRLSVWRGALEFPKRLFRDTEGVDCSRQTRIDSHLQQHLAYFFLRATV